MPNVIERHGHTIDDAGGIHYDESPVSWEAADKIAGRRLDRRKNYAIIDGEICSSVQWTAKCSGCSDGDPDASAGFGCHECGHTGKIRSGSWVPDRLTNLET